jgi:SnoaL-like domain
MVVQTLSMVTDMATTRAHTSEQSGKRKRAKQSRIPAEDFKSIMQTNAHFYSSFSSLDMVSMEDVWLRDNRCICQFPGHKQLLGYDKIMKSWKHAVKHMDGAMRRNWMEPHDIQVEFQTRDKAVVFCRELVYSISCSIVDGVLRPESQLIQKLSATNAFKRVDGKWYIWYHQASTISEGEGNLKVDRKEPVVAKPVYPKTNSDASTLHQSEVTSLTTQTFEDNIPLTHTSDTCVKDSNCSRLMNFTTK